MTINDALATILDDPHNEAAREAIATYLDHLNGDTTIISGVVKVNPWGGLCKGLYVGRECLCDGSAENYFLDRFENKKVTIIVMRHHDPAIEKEEDDT